jgi:hypothetical protein
MPCPYIRICDCRVDYRQYKGYCCGDKAFEECEFFKEVDGRRLVPDGWRMLIESLVGENDG